MRVKSEGPQARDTERWGLPVMVTADWRIQVALLIILHIWLSKVIKEERSCWGLMFKGALSVWEIIFGHPIFYYFFFLFFRFQKLKFRGETPDLSASHMATSKMNSTINAWANR